MLIKVKKKESKIQCLEKQERIIPNYGKPRPEGAGKSSQQIEVTDIKNNTITSYRFYSRSCKSLKSE